MKGGVPEVIPEEGKNVGLFTMKDRNLIKVEHEEDENNPSPNTPLKPLKVNAKQANQK